MTEYDITEYDIIEALRVKCASEAFFPHAKLGPTHGAQVQIMDAVSLRKSWAHPCINGFEVKISRSDFTRDEKWPDYLAACNRFYWACPKGLIKPNDIDSRCGLIWVNEGGVAHTRVAARFRDIDAPDGLLMYLIMTRLDNPYARQADNRTSLKAWLAGKQSDAALGREVKTRLVRRVADLSIRLENLQLDRKAWEATLAKYGITEPWQLANRLSQKPNALVTSVLNGAISGLIRARDKLSRSRELEKP